FAHRVLAAYVYAGAGMADFAVGRRGDGEGRIARAVEIHAATTPDLDATAHYYDLYDTTAGILKLHEAAHLEARRQLAAAADRYREAGARFDGLLAIYPKAFQYRIYKFQILVRQAPLLAALGRRDDAERCRKELLALEEAVLKDSPKVTFIRQLA